MPRKNSSIKKVSKDSSYLEKIETNIESNQSKVSLVLGALIVLVIGILVFNYFNRNKASLGPAQQTETQTQTEKQDVSKNNLPGDYTVKDGDTLFIIAEKYYQDGDKFTEIAKANNLADVNEIVVGQVLKIPAVTSELGTGGGNTTIWGTRVEGNTYTVVEGDWLSTIAGRAYGDIMAFDKIAKANNISNPDLIEPGMVLTIPR